MIGTSFGNSASSGSSFSGLLDDYPSASAAYSVRLLKSDYADGLVEIRRSSDNDVKTFYPDASNELSLTSEDGAGTTLTSWIGSDDGFVRTWYDQSGNAKDMTQTSASIQPQVVASGVVITQGAKASVIFTNDYFNAITGLEGLANLTSFLVQRSADMLYIWLANNDGGGSKFGYINQASSSTAVYSNYGTPTIYKNGILEAPANRSAVNTLFSTDTLLLRTELDGNTSNWATFDMFNYFSTVRYTGYASEMIFYAADKSADRAGIETNINDHYTIY